MVRRLDDIVDYLTFVFVPAFMVGWWHLVPPAWSAAVIAAMLLSSAYGFSQTQAKTSDCFFTGFPSYWSIVVLYLYALRLPAPVNGWCCWDWRRWCSFRSDTSIRRGLPRFVD